MVVDDEPQIRELLQTVLVREGYRVTVRSEAAAALRDVHESAVAILITDLKMPRMSGLELLQAAKAVQPDLGSILITGYASTETAVEALRFGADDFITKPFALQDLRRVVDRVLSEKRMLCQERDALDLAREETESLRVRSRVAEAALETAKKDLDVSQRDLHRRVRDLEFVSELTALLAREEDLQCLLETSARVLTRRFNARVSHIEVALSTGVFMAQHLGPDGSARLLASAGGDLVERARQDGFTQFAVDELDGALWTAAKHKFVLPEALRVPEAGATAKKEFARSLEVLERRLGDGLFVTGETFTVPDLIIGHCAGWAVAARFPLPESGALADYFARLRGRAALRRAMEKAAG